MHHSDANRIAHNTRKERRKDKILNSTTSSPPRIKATPVAQTPINSKNTVTAHTTKKTLSFEYIVMIIFIVIMAIIFIFGVIENKRSSSYGEDNPEFDDKPHVPVILVENNKDIQSEKSSEYTEEIDAETTDNNDELLDTNNTESTSDNCLYVGAKNLNLHNSLFDDGSDTSILEFADEVCVLDKSAKKSRIWYQVSSPQGIGWVNSAYLLNSKPTDRSILEDLPLDKSRFPELKRRIAQYNNWGDTLEKKVKTCFYVGARQLNVRSSPTSTTSGAILQFGEKVCLQDYVVKGNRVWCKVQSDTAIGWVNSAFLLKSKPTDRSLIENLPEQGKFTELKRRINEYNNIQ